jgi:hypothetical protein
MPKDEPDYLSYLLRLWRVRDGEKPSCGAGEAHRAEEQGIWRVSLHSVHTGEQQSFASLDDLFAFLQRQTGVRLPVPDRQPRRTEVFTVRIPVEHLGQSPSAWQGEIEYAGRREVMHFDDVDEMLECTRRLAAKTELRKSEHEQVE